MKNFKDILKKARELLPVGTTIKFRNAILLELNREIAELFSEYTEHLRNTKGEEYANDFLASKDLCQFQKWIKREAENKKARRKRILESHLSLFRQLAKDYPFYKVRNFKKSCEKLLLDPELEPDPILFINKKDPLWWPTLILFFHLSSALEKIYSDKIAKEILGRRYSEIFKANSTPHLLNELVDEWGEHQFKNYTRRPEWKELEKFHDLALRSLAPILMYYFALHLRKSNLNLQRNNLLRAQIITDLSEFFLQHSWLIDERVRGGNLPILVETIIEGLERMSHGIFPKIEKVESIRDDAKKEGNWRDKCHVADLTDGIMREFLGMRGGISILALLGLIREEKADNRNRKYIEQVESAVGIISAIIQNQKHSLEKRVNAIELDQGIKDKIFGENGREILESVRNGILLEALLGASFFNSIKATVIYWVKKDFKDVRRYLFPNELADYEDLKNQLNSGEIKKDKFEQIVKAKFLPAIRYHDALREFEPSQLVEEKLITLVYEFLLTALEQKRKSSEPQSLWDIIVNRVLSECRDRYSKSLKRLREKTTNIEATYTNPVLPYYKQEFYLILYDSLRKSSELNEDQKKIGIECLNILKQHPKIDEEAMNKELQLRLNHLAYRTVKNYKSAAMAEIKKRHDELVHLIKPFPKLVYRIHRRWRHK